MTPRRARIIGLSVLALCFVAFAASVPLEIANSRATDSGVVIVGDPDAPRVQGILEEIRGQDFVSEGTPPAAFVVVPLCFLWILVGVLIVSRQPRNWAGWTFMAVGAPFPLGIVSLAVVVYGARTRPDAVPLLSAWATVSEFALYPVALLPLLFLLYPDGHVPSPRWRWAARGLLGGTALAALGFLVRPGPFNNSVDDGILFVTPIGRDGFARISGALIAIGAVTALISALSTALAVTQRFRRSTDEQRQQMRLLALVAGIAGASLLMLFVLDLVAVALGLGEDGDPLVFTLLLVLTALTLVIGIPAAYLIAIFRYGLWDMDVVVRKTVQYAVLLVAFMLVGLVIVAAVPALLFGMGSGVSYLPTVLLAGVLSAVFLWLRPRAARLANRFVYGKRATPYEVLSEFSERVGETYSTDDVLPRMAQLVAEATGAGRVDVWLRAAGMLRPEAAWPTDAAGSASRPLTGDVIAARDGEYTAEVRHQGELLGGITLEPAPDDPMNPAKEALVRDLATQAGLVLRNVSLIEDLRESRRRIVAAQEERAKKLERDIHDGAQQQLVALAVKQRLATSLVGGDDERLRTMLGELGADTNDALENLRDLARGIYPPLLADRGLPAALDAQARKAPLPVDVDADGVGRYPQEVESAVYFSVLEALQNVAKYAEASRAQVRLRATDGVLSFEVADDGRGFDSEAARTGTGLQGVADRLAALGGEVDIESRPGEGTTMSGRVPAGEGPR